MLRRTSCCAALLLLGCATPAASEAPAVNEPPTEVSESPVMTIEVPDPSETPDDATHEEDIDAHTIHVGAEPWTRTARVPPVEPTHTGSLDPQSIRRVVRGHIDALRRCFELGLDRDAAVAGRIAISFTIGPSGVVEEAHASASEDYPYPEVPACIEAEMLRWSFPAPADGGSVIVSYPFNVDPG